jgi:hypothetical protein
LHVWQSVVTPPPHELVQHTLSTQVSTDGLCWHISTREQAPPTPWSTSHWCDTRLQNHVVGHSESELHAPWQAVLPALHGVVAPHATGFCVGQLPLLQVTAGTACAFGTAPEHDAGAPQGVVFGTAVLQAPLWHVSTVQGLPSLVHGVPLTTLVCVQPVVGATHASVLHGLPSSQLNAGPG